MLNEFYSERCHFETAIFHVIIFSIQLGYPIKIDIFWMSGLCVSVLAFIVVNYLSLNTKFLLLFVYVYQNPA